LYGDEGVLVGGFNNRGDGNIKLTNMPAILVEPLFANNPAHAQWIRGQAGQERLARTLADSIHRCFPDGGLIGFSVGHKGKTSKPLDRGAAVYGGGMEADFAEAVLLKAADMLRQAPQRSAHPLAVYVGNKEVWRYEADPDALVRWDETRGILFIDEPGALEAQSAAADQPVRRPPSRAAAKKKSARKPSSKKKVARKSKAKTARRTS
jgi:hypothetical protein